VAVTLSVPAWGALSGVGSAGLAFLYRGMQRGRISVVSPVSELAATVLPVLFGIAIGERLIPIVLATIVLKERLSVRQSTGLALAGTAVVLLGTA